MLYFYATAAPMGLFDYQNALEVVKWLNFVLIIVGSWQQAEKH